MYELLHTLDATNYGQYFGWRQATIWGVEEPESALHRDLETRLASQLRYWCSEEKYRLQVVQTTHSPIFAMAADCGYWTDLDGPESKLRPMEISELTRAAERRGVSGWVPPALAFPWNPVVLVEGPLDARVLSHVATIAALTHFRFLSLPGLDPNEPGGGKDSVIKYIRRNRELIRNRPRESPLLVLLDWDASNQDMSRGRTAYGTGGERHVLQMNSRYCSAELGDEFRGIERFYPPQVLREAHEADEVTLGIREGEPYSVSRPQLERAKKHLLKRLLRVDDPTALRPLVQVLTDLERVIRSDGPIQISLPEPGA